MPEYYIKREIFHIHKELIFYFSFITVVKIKQNLHVWLAWLNLKIARAFIILVSYHRLLLCKEKTFEGENHKEYVSYHSFALNGRPRGYNIWEPEPHNGHPPYRLGVVPTIGAGHGVCTASASKLQPAQFCTPFQPRQTCGCDVL